MTTIINNPDIINNNIAKHTNHKPRSAKKLDANDLMQQQGRSVLSEQLRQHQESEYQSSAEVRTAVSADDHGNNDNDVSLSEFLCKFNFTLSQI